MALTKISGNVVQQNNFSVGVVTATKVDVGSGVTIHSSGITVTGVITATSFVGSVAGTSSTATYAISAGYASTAGISTVAQGLTGTPNIVVGIVTASSLSVSGNVSIAGTITYEDVTNIDSLGIITARSGVQVTAGGINAVGVVTATSFSGPLTGNVTGNLTGEVNAASFDTNVAGVVVTGVATATSFSGSLTGNVTGNVTGNLTGEVNAAAFDTNVAGVVVTGVATATSFSGSGSGLTGVSTNFVSAIGIQSAGTVIGTGITQLNFIGLGNTFAVNGTTVDISIQGGGAGAGGTWRTYTAGIATSKSVGVNTTNLDDSDLVGVGNSFQGLYVSNGMIIFDNTLNGNHYIGTNFSGLIAGPANIAGVLTIDGEYVVV